MGDDHMKKNQQVKPRLEELYQGVLDESVNLTFQDLANVNSSHKTIEPLSEDSIISNPTTVPSPSLSPLSLTPSHDFKKGLQVSNHRHQYHNHHGLNHHVVGDPGHEYRFRHASGGAQSPHSRASEYSMGYDATSGESLASAKGGAGRRRRSGIPHSKMCTICCSYVYFFRTRCLVCGRVYCKQCVERGMGEMTEGRKCIECLGLRFSQRYIERAGIVWCCSWRYPITLKQVELKWAEKGPRRSGDKGYGHHHGMASSRPSTPTTPRSPFSFASNDASFVMSGTYSAFSPHRHLPL